ncbi:hypothetical protein [Brotaphodocola sp.]|uniref:hypothetical protein n=1 Tax=Brotaphodocola sp. TaxID=3073577 RepID=UPI003D7ED32F
MKKKLLIGIAIAILAVSGVCGYKQINKIRQISQLQNEINEVLQYENNTLTELQNIESLYNEYPEKLQQKVSNIEEVKYREAKVLTKEKEYELAYQKYEEIIGYENSVNLQNELCYNWARSLQKNNELDKAVAVAKKIPKEKSENISELLFQLICLEYDPYITQKDYEKTLEAFDVMSQYGFPEESYYEYAKYLKNKIPAIMIDDIWILYSRKNINLENLYIIDTGENICDLKSIDENTLNVNIKRNFENVNSGNYYAKFKEATAPYSNTIYLYYEIDKKMEIAIPLNYQEEAYVTFWGTKKKIKLGNQSFAKSVENGTSQSLVLNAENSVPTIGMSADEVRHTSWGSPETINKTTYSWGIQEQWVYPNNNYVYLENGIVTAIQEQQ